MGGRAKNSVQIDKYALENVLIANEVTAKDVSKMMGHAGNYLSQVYANGGHMKRRDYDNLKGLLRVTDNDIIKAVPVQRREEVVSIYQPTPICKTELLCLDDDNKAFLETLIRIGGGDKAKIINSIVTYYRTHSAVGEALEALVLSVKDLSGEPI